jgi:hypothetical protein
MSATVAEAIKKEATLLQSMSPLVAQSGHFTADFQCPLLG